MPTICVYYQKNEKHRRILCVRSPYGTIGYIINILLKRINFWEIKEKVCVWVTHKGQRCVSKKFKLVHNPTQSYNQWLTWNNICCISNDLNHLVTINVIKSCIFTSKVIKKGADLWCNITIFSSTLFLDRCYSQMLLKILTLVHSLYSAFES